MKINNYILKSLLGSVALFALVFTGCKDEETYGDAPRLFRPVSTVTATTVDLRPQLVVDLETAIAGATSYQYLAYLADSVVGDSVYFSYNNLVAEGITDSIQYTFGVNETLSWDTQYAIQVKSVGPELTSEYFTTVETTDDFPTNLKSFNTAEIIDVAAIARWNTSDEKYTFIDLTDNSDSILQRFDLTAVDVDSAMFELLEPLTSYKVKAYVGEVPVKVDGEPFVAVPESNYRGKKLFKTIASEVYDISVDLRGISSDSAKKVLTSEFIAGLENGCTVVLKGGETYNISSTKFIDKSVKFVTGYTLTGKAKMAIVGDFKLTTALVNPKVEFEKIYFFTPNADATTANYGGKYVFNMDVAGTSITDISFNNCDFKFFRGIVRSRVNSLVENVEFNNCTFTYIGGYGLLIVDDATGTIQNMTLKNSTVSMADKVFVNTKNASGTKNVTVENVTFATSPTNDAKSYMFDFNAISPVFKFSNCIFAKSREGGAAASGGNGGSCGFRAGSSADFSSCYKTSDFIFYLATGGASELGPMTGILQYPNTWTTLFANPTAFDYTLKDASFVGKGVAGDPRWW